MKQPPSSEGNPRVLNPVPKPGAGSLAATSGYQEETEREPGRTGLRRLTTSALRDHRTRRLSSIAMRSGGCFDGSRYNQTMKRQAPMNSKPAQISR